MTSFSSFFVALYSYSFCEVIMYVRSLFQLTDRMLSLKMSNGCICQEDLQFSTVITWSSKWQMSILHLN